MTNNKKKRNNNKKKRSPPSAIGNGKIDITKILSTKTMTYHGSTAGKFSPGSDYRQVIDAYRAMFNKVIVCGGSATEAGRIVMSKFTSDHHNFMIDPEFGQFVFAMSTQINLCLEDDELRTSLEKILSLGLNTKYFYTPMHKGDTKPCGGDELFQKYMRDIQTESGTINCLERETKDFCDCMKSAKEEAKKMEKLGKCTGCRGFFPKENLRRCSCCNIAQFCTTECHRQNWYEHKTYCMKL